MAREWTEDMGEISGFGGSYEAACRAMVLAGLEWWDQHPEANPQVHEFKGVAGVAIEDNEDAEALTKAMMDARVTMEDGREVRVGDEATGAMHHFSLRHVYAARRLGWEEYQRQMRERDEGHDDE